MFTSRVNELLSPCACGNKEIVVEYDHEEDIYTVSERHISRYTNGQNDVLIRKNSIIIKIYIYILNI